VSKCKKQEKTNLEKTWLSSQGSAQSGCTGLFDGSPDSVRWCTGQCPVRQAGGGQLAALGFRRRRTTINHWTVRWCTGLSGEPTVGRANGRPRNPRATRGRANGQKGGTGQCPVRQRLQDFNGRLRKNRKEIHTGQCPVVHRTVRCARR
jgi:hypothetical protein